MTNSDQPAFPWHTSPGNQANLGLTKREWLAGMAMQGIIAYWGETYPANEQVIASFAVKFSDSLLAELEKKTP